jgi:hypothetical protein
MDSVSVKPKPSFDQSISGLVIALFTARFPLVILFSRLLLFNILFFSLLLLLNLLFCIIGLRLPAAEDDDDAEEEATTLELFETVGRKTIVVIVEDALDAIIFSRSVFVFSLSLSQQEEQYARRCEKESPLISLQTLSFHQWG